MVETHDSETASVPTPRLARTRRWLRALACVTLLYVTGCAVLYFYQDHMVFPTDMAPEPLRQVADPGIVPLRLDLAGGGQVEAWFVPAPGITPEQAGPLVVFCHGNAELIDYQDEIVRGYHALGCSVMMPEYRGYGRSAGTPSQKAIRDDSVRFYDQVITRPEVDTTRIVFHGRSLGGGVAADLAAQRRPAALILESTFTSVAAMAHRYGVPSFLAKHPFRTDRVILHLDAPVLIFHGTRDDIIPVKHGRRLHAIRPDAVYIEYDCAHNDFPGRGNRDAYWAEIARFLGQAGILTQAG